MKQSRLYFHVKIGEKLSNYHFRQSYRMKHGSFDKLCGILETRLKEIFVPGGEGEMIPDRYRHEDHHCD